MSAKICGRMRRAKLSQRVWRKMTSTLRRPRAVGVVSLALAAGVVAQTGTPTPAVPPSQTTTPTLENAPQQAPAPSTVPAPSPALPPTQGNTPGLQPTPQQNPSPTPALPPNLPLPALSPVPDQRSVPAGRQTPSGPANQLLQPTVSPLDQHVPTPNAPAPQLSLIHI